MMKIPRQELIDLLNNKKTLRNLFDCNECIMIPGGGSGGGGGVGSIITFKFYCSNGPLPSNVDALIEPFSKTITYNKLKNLSRAETLLVNGAAQYDFGDFKTYDFDSINGIIDYTTGGGFYPGDMVVFIAKI